MKGTLPTSREVTAHLSTDDCVPPPLQKHTARPELITGEGHMLITCFMVHHTAVSLSVSYIHIVFWMLSLAECWPVCFLVGLFPSPLIAWCQRVKLWARQWCSTPESLLLRTLYNTTCRVISLFPLTYQLTVCPFALTGIRHITDAAYNHTS